MTYKENSQTAVDYYPDHKHEVAMVWYGLIMHFCDSNHEITRSSKRKYNNIKDR